MVAAACSIVKQRIRIVELLAVVSALLSGLSSFSFSTSIFAFLEYEYEDDDEDDLIAAMPR